MGRHQVTFATVGALVMFVVTASICPAAATGQAPGQKAPTLIASSMAGGDLFEFYCATCHGRDGRGHGPVAATLTTPPSDLTSVARANGGQFPSDAVRAMIVGERVLAPAHGEHGMPVWGPIFQGLDPNEIRNKVRVANIVSYIASIQSK